MAGETIFICAGCGPDAADFAAAVAQAARKAGLPVDIVTPGCMNVCARPFTVAARARGKRAYLFADVDPTRHLEGLLAFARLYVAAPEGEIADARPLGDLRTRLVGQIPAPRA